ncbi:MAG: hypothetical protein M1546_19820 [Chloroflexi bacterium]|nr:hypothetical protein [Chloroflexota bacterium]
MADKPNEKPTSAKPPTKKTEKQIKDMLKKHGRDTTKVDAKSMRTDAEVRRGLMELHMLGESDYTGAYIG